MRPSALGDAVPKRGNAFMRFWGRSVLSVLGWRIEGQLPNRSKFVVILAPHTSNWDFILGVATMLALGLSANWLGKHTIFVWPLDPLLRWLGGIPVDRNSQNKIVDQTVALFDSREKMVLGLSPEGTRKKVHKWRTGFYYIASRANVPIVLVSMDYSKKIFGLGPVIAPCGDLEKDMEQILAYYSTVKGKYPELFSGQTDTPP